jgi:hypothetical protein
MGKCAVRAIQLLSLCLCISIGAALSGVSAARAQDDGPGVFAHGFRGLMLGGLVGASTGYLMLRPGGMHGDDYRNLGFATGVGALVGAGVGVGMGILDVGSAPPRLGNIFMRDVGGGIVLGGALGAIVGGLHVIRSDDKEDILHGATIGVVAGAGAGVVGGLLEWIIRPRGPGASASKGGPHRVTTTVTVSEDVSGRRVVGPMVMGRF